MTHPVGRPTVGAQPSPLPLAGTGGSSSLEGNDPVTTGTHKTLCVVECGGMDVQGSQTLAPTRSAWPILCLRIVGVCGMAPPPLLYIPLRRCEDSIVVLVDSLQPMGVPPTMPHAGVAIHVLCSSTSLHFAAGGGSSSSRIQEALVLPPQRL